jgi:hypothetical protein
MQVRPRGNAGTDVEELPYALRGQERRRAAHEVAVSPDVTDDGGPDGDDGLGCRPVGRVIVLAAERVIVYTLNAVTPSGGSFEGVGALSARQSGSYSVVRAPLTFQAGDATAYVALDRDGKVAGLGMEYPRWHRLRLRRSVRFFAIGNGDPEVSRTLHASGMPGPPPGPARGNRWWRRT